MATLYEPVYAKFLTAHRGAHRGTERPSSHSLEAAVRTEGNPPTPTPGPSEPCRVAWELMSLRATQPPSHMPQSWPCPPHVPNSCDRHLLNHPDSAPARQDPATLLMPRARVCACASERQGGPTLVRHVIGDRPGKAGGSFSFSFPLP